MRLLTILIALFFLLVISFSQTNTNYKNSYWQDYAKADKLFHEAESLSFQKNYDEAKEEELNKQSLDIFLKIIPQVEKVSNDSLAFFCHSKAGLLWHYFDSLELAKAEYQKAVDIKAKLPAIADSFLFQPLLFLGSIHYSRFEVDSAYLFYKKAEALSEKYPTPLNEQERLYNRLGTMYYEAGNFKQAKNYFERAILLLKPSNPFYTDFLINYRSNIASSFLKLERFAEADSIYQSILPLNINKNEILQNIGSVSLMQGYADKALNYFKQVKYNSNLNILLYNRIGKAYLLKNNLDSTNKYLALAAAENTKWNGPKKNILYGFTLQYLGDKYAVENKYIDAIENYQKAIMQFYPTYNETNIYKNPENFTGFFSYINLFNTLTAKADAFEKLFEQDKKQESLDASLNVYTVAFKLADYVERTYESDEARLFLSKMKYNVHDKPIRISLQLYELTKNKKYIEEAYNFDQQNKASILSLNVQEQAVKNQLVSGSSLFEKESEVKKLITRLSIKAAQISDSSQLQKINETIRDNEIELGKLQEKMNDLSGYRAKKFAQTIPTVAQVQNMLYKNAALLSYHLAKSELVILCITKKEITYNKLIIDSSFSLLVDSLKNSLTNLSAENQYTGTAMSKQLYKLTIQPIWDKIKDMKNLIIIPDDELNNLPFETLTNEQGDYLLQNFSIQYQYSTALLRDDIKRKSSNEKSLAMAPFSDNNYGAFAKLTYSKKEIENIQGDVLLDSTATKKRFLATAQNYNTLHLATHTIINNTNPNQSLITFYPTPNLPTNETNLYVQEIYNLNLSNTNLVILSACETGTGKLAKGEGLLSLARAFTYAGCPNIIASLWKADDKSTAWIIQRFYQYQKKGISAANSLQKAKLDYIQSPDIEKRFKTPNYWAHLVLTGIPEATTTTNYWFWIVGIAIIILLFLLYKKFRNKP
jgi:CHAT domain-containing protein/tetratricopeptide (TPR) repeat protein